VPPQRWGLDVGPDGELAYRGTSLAGLRRRWGSPLRVVLGERLRANAQGYLGAGGGRLRGEVFYSYKTNPVPGVLALLRDEGVGAEVISEYELWLALRLGVPPERIVFNGPAKSPASIRTAIERAILLVNLNHREEIPVVAQVARSVGRRPRVGVRVAASVGWSGQFGSSIATGEALRAIEEAHASGALDVRALHCHVGGMLRSTAQAAVAVDEVLRFTDLVRGRLGIELEILDFGGSLAAPNVARLDRRDVGLNASFGVDLQAPAPEATMDAAAQVAAVIARVEAHYAALGKRAPRVLFEPGRSMTGDAEVLVASVVGTKAAVDAPVSLVLDAGINLAEPMTSEYHHVFPATRTLEPASRRSRLVGPICTPGDVLRWSVRLPALGVGDAVAIMDAGAYFTAFETSFSFPRPAIVLLDGGSERLLRRRETFDDLVSRDGPEETAASRSPRRVAGAE
jgi:diaminopimelate decarboxylase